MLKLIRRLLILVIAALLGSIYYYRVQAVDNVGVPALVEKHTRAPLLIRQEPHNPVGKVGGTGKVGGLGPVTHVHDENNP